MDFLEGYLQYLNEDRGLNLPVERDQKPNYIGRCMMQEDDRVKIRCLRKLKELTAMNPFYQYRIDRFVDAITGTYEATVEPGFNEYKLEESVVLTEQKRNKRAADEIERVLKCGRLPKQYRNFIELYINFEPLEIAGHDVGDHKISNMHLDVIKDTLLERKYLKEFPHYLLAISPLGNGDYWVLNCKDGKVYLTSHDYAGYQSYHKKPFDLNEYLEEYSKDFKLFLIKRSKEGKSYLRNKEDVLRLKEIIGAI